MSRRVRDRDVVDSLLGTEDAADAWCEEISSLLDKIDDANNQGRWTDDDDGRDAAHRDLEDAATELRRLLSEIRVNAREATYTREPTKEDAAEAAEAARADDDDEQPAVPS